MLTFNTIEAVPFHFLDWTRRRPPFCLWPAWFNFEMSRSFFHRSSSNLAQHLTKRPLWSRRNFCGVVFLDFFSSSTIFFGVVFLDFFRHSSSKTCCNWRHKALIHGIYIPYVQNRIFGIPVYEAIKLYF